MKKCGTLEEPNEKHVMTVKKLTEKFVGPLEEGTVTGYRDLFGLLDEEGADSFGTIAIHAEA
jgi:hypothetical protein